MIDIVCNIDQSYIAYCGVMLGSLFEHNPSETFCIHAISSRVTPAQQMQLITFCQKYKATLTFYNVDFDSIKDFPIKAKDHLSLAAYLRLFMSELLPSDIDKVLYLDCDMIVVDSIRELWNIDISQVAVAAVEERPPYDTDSPLRLGYPSSFSYFNSGVMLINLKRWREKDLLRHCKEFLANQFEKIRLHDQDVLNALLYDERLFLPIRWNVMDFFLFTRPLVQECRKEALQQAIAQPGIIHFTGKRKPWLHSCDSPYRNYYLKLARKYHWKVITPQESIRYYLRRCWYVILTATHLQRKRTVDIPKKYRC